MRFALMTEPQQGLSYDDILAAARAAEAAGLERVLPLRSLPQLSRSLRPAHHRRLGHPGRAGARDQRRSTSARSSRRSPSGIPGNFAKIVGHRRRDERRPPRGRHGCRLVRRGTPRARVPVRHRCPSDTTGSRRRSPSSTACGPNRTVGASRAGAGRSARRASIPSPPASGQRHPHLILGGDGLPRQAAAGRPLGRRVQPQLRDPGAARAQLRDGSAPPARPSVATRTRSCCRP